MPPIATELCSYVFVYRTGKKDRILGSGTEAGIVRFVVNNSDGNMYRLESEKALLIYTTAERAAEQIEHFRAKSNATVAKIGAIHEMDPKAFIEFLEKHAADYPNIYVDTLATRTVAERLVTAQYLQDFKRQVKQAAG